MHDATLHVVMVRKRHRGEDRNVQLIFQERACKRERIVIPSTSVSINIINVAPELATPIDIHREFPRQLLLQAKKSLTSPCAQAEIGSGDGLLLIRDVSIQIQIRSGKGMPLYIARNLKGTVFHIVGIGVRNDSVIDKPQSGYQIVGESIRGIEREGNFRTHETIGKRYAVAFTTVQVNITIGDAGRRLEYGGIEIGDARTSDLHAVA